MLKPGAEFHFAEHGLAPDAKVARVAAALRPVADAVRGGCHLARDMRALVAGAGFEIDELETRFIKGPKAWSYMYFGRARKPGVTP